MIDAASNERPADIERQPPAVRLFVATWFEALPLLGFAPRVTGMGRRTYDFAGCAAVLSAGFAGACQPKLQPGDVLLTADIRTLDHVASPAEKASLGREGVAGVDMETAWLADAAAAAGVPFFSLRVVIDRMEDRAFGPATALHYPTAAHRLRQVVAEALRSTPSPAAAGEGIGLPWEPRP